MKDKRNRGFGRGEVAYEVCVYRHAGLLAASPAVVTSLRV